MNTTTMVINGQEFQMYDWQASYLAGFFAGQSSVMEKTMPLLEEFDRNLDSLQNNSTNLLNQIDRFAKVVDKFSNKI